jgi:hypothetical protein
MQVLSGTCNPIFNRRSMKVKAVLGNVLLSLGLATAVLTAGCGEGSSGEDAKGIVNYNSKEAPKGKGSENLKLDNAMQPAKATGPDGNPP